MISPTHSIGEFKISEQEFKAQEEKKQVAQMVSYQNQQTL